MPKHISEEDKEFFRLQMQGVKPIKKDKVLLRVKPSKPKIRKNNFAVTEEFPFSDYIRETVTTETKLFFAQQGVQEKTLRSLRQGKITQTKILDLHGATVAQARKLLSDFLAESVEQEHHCVQIIHGKGKLATTAPLLKNHVNSWLQQYPAILAFCSAIPRDGGAGAVYVLLRRKRSID